MQDAARGDRFRPILETRREASLPVDIARGGAAWPGLPDDSQPLPPQGVLHHYAPLALLTRKTVKDDFRTRDARRLLQLIGQ